MIKSASTRAALLPYPVIAATRTSYDAHGCPYSYVDEELRRRLETKLIITILDFDLS